MLYSFTNLIKCSYGVILFLFVHQVSSNSQWVPLMTRTSTITSYLTSVAECTLTTSCASILGPVTRCRRLRRQLMDVDEIFPTKPDRVDMTAAPVEEVNAPIDLEPTLITAVDDDDFSASISTLGDRRVLVNGLNGNCWTDFSFGITIFRTTTVTSDFTCDTYLTHTNTFTLSGCTPVGLQFCPFE